MARKPWEIFNTLVSSKSLRNLFAQRFARKAESADPQEATVYAWGRPVESDEYPTGTGKPNPLDLLLRIMNLSHSMFPVEVREIAETVVQEANRLDMEHGFTNLQNGGDPCAAVMKSIRQQLDVLEHVKTSDFTTENIKNLEKVWTEFETSFYQLKGCIQAVIEKHK
jgi:hypothetical protein